MNRYIIFDMDGVVIDSEGWYLNLLRNFLSNNNFNIPDKVLMETIGLDMIHMFKRIESYISGNDIEKLIEKYLDYIKSSGEPDYLEIAFPNVKDCFYKLHDLNIDIVIASSSPRNVIKKVLEKLDLNRFVEFYIGREDVKNTKPDPEIYNAILKIKKGKPLFVVEDSEFGIKSAKMAGLKVVAFNSKIYNLNQKESDYIVTDHNQIICLI